MPIRSPSNGTPENRVGRADPSGLSLNESFCIDGIDLTTQQIPEHNEYLEAMLTGKYNVFSQDTVDEIYLYRTSTDGGGPRRCYYTAVWNVAVRGVSLGKRPHDACTVLRNLLDSNFESSVCYLRSNLLPNSCAASESARTQDFMSEYPRTINPAITDKVLKTLSEEGIMEEDAKIALDALIRNGTIRTSILKDGSPLFMYGNDRRHIVSRVLNYITSMRESEQPGRPTSVPGHHNPAIDMLTGESVGFSSVR